LDVRVVLHRRPRIHPRARSAADELEHVGPHCLRRARAAFDRRHASIGEADHQARDAADAAGERLDHAHDERRGHRRVDRVAAGATIAYTVSEIDAAADEYVSSIWIADAAGAQPPKRLTELGKKKSGAPRISPDGTLVAFISDRESEKPQLYVMPASGGQAKR